MSFWDSIIGRMVINAAKVFFVTLLSEVSIKVNAGIPITVRDLLLPSIASAAMAVFKLFDKTLPVRK